MKKINRIQQIRHLQFKIYITIQSQPSRINHRGHSITIASQDLSQNTQQQQEQKNNIEDSNYISANGKTPTG